MSKTPEEVKREILEEVVKTFVEPTIPGTLGAIQAEHFRLFTVESLDRMAEAAVAQERQRVIDYVIGLYSPEVDADDLIWFLSPNKK